MAYRPPTGARRLPTGTGRPPTGYRMGTGMRPGSRSGAGPIGGALNSQIAVPDRPVTQQGLGGMGTGMRGPARQVQDKSYFLGLMRSKIGELNNEIMKLSRELEQLQQESATYLTYEKRAEVLAAEVEDLRGELADYNTLIDKLTTDTEIDAIQTDYNNLCRHNEALSHAIDAIFAEKHETEIAINQLETAIEQEKRLTETLVESMDDHVRQSYFELKQENGKIKAELQEKEEELDKLTKKASRMQEDVANSELKQKSLHLRQQLAEVVAKRDEWKLRDQETPEQERARLLQQVKQDNQEIGSLEKKITELQEKLEQTHDQVRQIESDLDDVQGEKSAKLKDLKTKERQRKEFLSTFEDQKKAEQERIKNLEENIVAILEHISQNVMQSDNLLSAYQFQEMQEDLLMKQDDMAKTSSTVEALEMQCMKQQKDLLKVDELEEKIKGELMTLRQEIDTMTQEVEHYSDLGQLQQEEEEKKQILLLQKEDYIERKEVAKRDTQYLVEKYETENNKLTKEDTHTQLTNLERKLQYLEQNNFVMKESIATRLTEGNYQQIAKDVYSLQKNYNDLLA